MNDPSPVYFTQVCRCGHPLIPENNNRCPECGEVWVQPLWGVVFPGWDALITRIVITSMIGSAATFSLVLAPFVPVALFFVLVLHPMTHAGRRVRWSRTTFALLGILGSMFAFGMISESGRADGITAYLMVAVAGIVLYVLAVIAIGARLKVMPSLSRFTTVMIGTGVALAATFVVLEGAAIIGLEAESIVGFAILFGVLYAAWCAILAAAILIAFRNVRQPDGNAPSMYSFTFLHNRRKRSS